METIFFPTQQHEIDMATQAHFEHDSEKGFENQHFEHDRRRSSVAANFEHQKNHEDIDQVLHDDVHRQWLDVDEGLDPKEIARVNRKIDWRLLPILGAMYTISQIDRSNLGLARSANNGKMNDELGLRSVNGKTNNRYSIITLAFFIPYLILEVPVSSILLPAFSTMRCLWNAAPPAIPLGARHLHI